MKLVRADKQQPAEEKPKYTDLRQVMDYTKPLSIFFSGVEYESYIEILYNLGIRNFLMSYEYLKGKGLNIVKKYTDIRLFIDSGAYTYMNDPKFNDYTVEQWEQQIETYLKWAERHKSQIFAICDLDLQYLVGNEKVYEWRKKYFEPFMLRTGIPVCFMYHDEGMEQWEYMCKRYPYVGLSLAIDKLDNGYQILKEMFRIADKHNALCQGMASTQTSLLTEFPFYTVDSTTWNVGLKFGEISVWDKTHMRRFKKEDFQNKAFPLISGYDKKFDFNKILAEDKTEMIRVNAYAFVMAEKFIQERLRSTMYWFKRRVTRRKIEDIDQSLFPPPDWFNDEMCTNMRSIALAMNVNPDLENCDYTIGDITAIMNWDNPVYEDLVNEYKVNDYKILRDIHDMYVNRIVGTTDEMLADLKKYFTGILTGEDDSLLQKGTNFDRTTKERESYVEDDTTELTDMTEEEVKERLHNLLPDLANSESGAPEVDALDEEIFRKAEIVPVWDERGKFVKGQKSVHKPKRLYSDKFPKLACDTCYAAARCPEYRQGYVCAYNKMFQRYDTRDMGDIIQATQGIVDYNMQRMQRAMVLETVTGAIDSNVSSLMDTNMRYLQMLRQMYENGSAEVLKQTKVVRADGSEETTTSITNPQSGGIMEKLFGSMMASRPQPEEPQPEENVIEVKPNDSE